LRLWVDYHVLLRRLAIDWYNYFLLSTGENSIKKNNKTRETDWNPYESENQEESQDHQEYACQYQTGAHRKCLLKGE